jgi:hypothetical protein
MLVSGLLDYSSRRTKMTYPKTSPSAPAHGAPSTDWIAVAATAHHFLICHTEDPGNQNYHDLVREQLLESLTSLAELEKELHLYGVRQQRRFKPGDALRGPDTPYAAYCMLVEGVIRAMTKMGACIVVREAPEAFYWRPRRRYGGRYGECKEVHITSRDLRSGQHLKTISPLRWKDARAIDSYIFTPGVASRAPQPRPVLQEAPSE